jgi:hypothetical protein
MADPNDDASRPNNEDREPPAAVRPLRLNLLRWDSEWLKRRLEAVQDQLDHAVEGLEKPED